MEEHFLSQNALPVLNFLLDHFISSSCPVVSKTPSPTSIEAIEVSLPMFLDTDNDITYPIHRCANKWFRSDLSQQILQSNYINQYVCMLLCNNNISLAACLHEINWFIFFTEWIKVTSTRQTCFEWKALLIGVHAAFHK